ncbi:hypothetical protein R0137_03990 [Congregibacter brevis]|uniref:Tight adherence protein B n=1 Tax=Congregibacter brevis TaxID=3081201 RepID=A0ABZ0IHE0_9GAMM|nr:hypothetical protein R0137_03990 [Congregibacter sp. IMCC45268]
MNKYFAIIDLKTVALAVICVVVTYFCFALNIAYDLDITLFSIAVIFPLVFTIREAFKRRDNALKFLSQFKSGLCSVHYCFEQCKKLDPARRVEVSSLLDKASSQFFDALGSEDKDTRPAEDTVNEIIYFIQRNDDAISNGLALKIIRFVQEVNEGMENTISLKMHGTPISMRAYCLVFVFLFPFVFSPTIVYHLPDAPIFLTYGLSVLHGFILISLYNVQVQMENPFDQIGLDDIQLDEFRFRALEPSKIPLE